jgi:hypothetical protein
MRAICPTHLREALNSNSVINISFYFLLINRFISCDVKIKMNEVKSRTETPSSATNILESCISMVMFMGLVFWLIYGSVAFPQVSLTCGHATLLPLPAVTFRCRYQCLFGNISYEVELTEWTDGSLT